MGDDMFSLCGMDLAEIVKGVSVRLMFALHVGTCSLVVMGMDEAIHRQWPVYMYAGFVTLLLMEACWCLCGLKTGYNWKLFSPTVALYIVCTAACIWFMELHLYEMRIIDVADDDEYNSRQNLSAGLVKYPECQVPQLIDCEIPFINVVLDLDTWLEVLLQWMIFSLIIGRWLLPKGTLTRDQLSQLLLVQVAMGADILELILEGTEANFQCKQDVVLVLSVWSWSLTQFTLSLTVTKSRGPKAAVPRRSVEDEQVGVTDSSSKAETGGESRDLYGWSELCCATEMWSIFLTSIVMQDLPFLVLRLYIMMSDPSSSTSSSGTGTVSGQAIFFSFKNALVILLQVYRMAVIVAENRRKKAEWAKRQAVVLTSQTGQHELDTAERQERLGDSNETEANGTWHSLPDTVPYLLLDEDTSETRDERVESRNVGSQTGIGIQNDSHVEWNDENTAL